MSHPFRSSSDGLIHPDDAEPRVPALALLTSVWIRRRSGILLGPNGEAMVILGRPLNHQGLIIMVEGLYSEGVVFREGPRLERPGRESLGPHLYEAGRRLADQSSLMARAHLVLADAPGAHAAMRLPIRPGTRALMLRRRETPTVPLNTLLAATPVDRDEVIEDLSVMVALGLYRFRDARISSHRRRTGDESMPPPRKRTDVLARRLRRDLSRMDGVDDWTVVGVNPMMGDEAIDRACAKMLRRYGHLVSDASIPPDARDIARILHQRISSAVARIRPQRSSQSEARL